MDWINSVEDKLKRKNLVLFAKDSEVLVDISKQLENESHRTCVLWAFEYAEGAVDTLAQRYPNEKRISVALATSKRWAEGKVKMREAQRAILDAHAVAKEIDSLEDIALCHAVGQACGVVHTSGHAIGFPIYELTSLVRKYGVPGCKEPIESRIQHYSERLTYWSTHFSDNSYHWAEFLT